MLTPQQLAIGELRWVESASHLLDTHFSVPGTRIRFGWDFLVGLFPAIGSFASMAWSAVLVAIMARHGASGRLVARMMLNLLVDAVLGSIPLAGNLFDLYFKANERNLRLMREYYGEGRHRGSAWPIVAGVLMAGLLLVALVAVMLWWVASWLVGMWGTGMPPGSSFGWRPVA